MDTRVSTEVHLGNDEQITVTQDGTDYRVFLLRAHRTPGGGGWGWSMMGRRVYKTTGRTAGGGTNLRAPLPPEMRRRAAAALAWLHDATAGEGTP